MPYQYALALYRSDVVGGESDPNSVAPRSFRPCLVGSVKEKIDSGPLPSMWRFAGTKNSEPSTCVPLGTMSLTPAAAATAAAAFTFVAVGFHAEVADVDFVRSFELERSRAECDRTRGDELEQCGLVLRTLLNSNHHARLHKRVGICIRCPGQDVRVAPVAQLR